MLRASAKILVNCHKCGKKMSVWPSRLANGAGKFCSKSCSSAASGTTHGLYKHPLYDVWTSMLQRCGNSKHEHYRHYGGRGITVCSKWKASVVAFYEWSIANGYRKGLEIDREKNDEGYSPGNCRFVTKQKNACNKRKKEGTSSKYRGVSRHRRSGKWCATYSRKYLGLFIVEEDAARIWDREAIAQGRELSSLNFPEVPISSGSVARLKPRIAAKTRLLAAVT